MDNNNKKVKGVHFEKATKNWIALIRHNNKLYRLGSFNDKEEAIRKRKIAEFVLFDDIRSIHELYEEQDN